MSDETTATSEPGTEIELAPAEPPAPPAPGPVMLPGEVRPHPTPAQYVVVAVILVVITAIEVSISYSTGTLPNDVIVSLLILLSFTKFFLVASWYMHLRTDRPVFRRFFILGGVGAITLYLIVLSALHAFRGGV